MTLSELAIQEYEDLERKLKINFTPLYPGVLIRVLPKEHMQGGLWIPDTKQNKPIYEGIVLRVYPSKRLQLDDGRWITTDSGLNVGDHILFPHWSGEPVPWLLHALKAQALEDEDYRIIPARGFLSLVGMKEAGEPFLILNYEKESVDEKLRSILVKLYSDSWYEGNKAGLPEYRVQLTERQAIELLPDNHAAPSTQPKIIADTIQQIKKEFDILVKVKASKTISGE